MRILDFQDTAPSIRRLRQWSFAQAGAGPGERAVDIGSGTGTVTRALATLVGPTLGTFGSIFGMACVNKCPADFDGNGFVNGDDADAFFIAFDVGDTSADFDGNGFVNGDDADAFAIAFENGC